MQSASDLSSPPSMRKTSTFITPVRMAALSVRSAMFSVLRQGIVGCGMNRRLRTRLREIDLFVGSSKHGIVHPGLDVGQLRTSATASRKGHITRSSPS